MPKLTEKLTDSVAKKQPVPPPGVNKEGKPCTKYELYWCAKDEGFAVRVTSTGARSWIMERRVDGETKRRTLGKAAGRGAISADDARKLMIITSGDMEKGADPLEVKRTKAREKKLDKDFDAALTEYVENKQRADGKKLKQRTRDEYLAMVKPPSVSPIRLRADGSPRKDSGRPRVCGELFPLAKKPLSKIVGEDTSSLYKLLLKERGQRRATYAMQVLRAVLNWHGVKVPRNPLGKDVPGRDRIILPPTPGNPRPIPADRLGAWYAAASVAGLEGNPGRAKSADYLRFVLLTGGRGSETAGNDWEEGILVRHLDVKGARILLPDPKNRKDHVIYLSWQALEIAQRLAEGKKAGDKLFDTRAPRKTLAAICKASGDEPRSLKDLRKTFASVAESLVSVYTLKAMLQHSTTGLGAPTGAVAGGQDVTGKHYISIGEEQMRRGWQTVADFIEELEMKQVHVLRELREARERETQADTAAA